MRVLIGLVLSSCLAISTINGKAAENCKCWDGYEANNGPDGPECRGILLLHSMPCNEPQPPQCKCSGNVTGILKDETGIWCSTYAEGKEVKRWSCENAEDWKKFFEQNPEYKP